MIDFLLKLFSFFTRKENKNIIEIPNITIITKTNTNANKISQNGVNFIKKWEGMKLNSYADSVGVWTIGYGTTRINGVPVTKGMTITESSAEEYLRKDIKNISESAISKHVKVPLNQNQYDALCSFIYNLGEANFLKSTLLKKLNQSDYESIPNEIKKWNKAGGKVLTGLVNRRQAEADLWVA